MIEYALIISGTVLGLLGIVGGLRLIISNSYSSAECQVGAAAGCTPSTSGTSTATTTTTPTGTPTGGPVDSVTTVSSTSLTPTLGQAVTFTASVVPSTATGIVYFVDGTTAIGSATLSGGQATMTTSTLAYGDHTITVVYPGSLSVNPSTSSAITVAVRRTTTTTLTFSPSTPGFGQSVTATATVTATPASPTPTGSIQFTGPGLNQTVAMAGGSASVSLGALAVGSYTYTATYVPSDGISAASSDTETLVVGKGATTLVLTDNDADNQATPGQSITFTATLQASGTPLAGQSITFNRNGTQLGTGTTNALGQATITWIATNVGGFASGSNTTSAFSASYAGNANYAASTSAVTTITVSLRGSSVSLNRSPNTVTRSTTVTLSGTVSLTSGQTPPAITGTVSIQQLNGATWTQIATATVGANGAYTTTYQWTTTGSKSIRAVYSGDADTATSTSSTMNFNVG